MVREGRPETQQKAIRPVQSFALFISFDSFNHSTSPTAIAVAVA